MMTLREWLFKTRTSIGAFASFIGISRVYLHKILSGECIPSEKVFSRIKEATHGTVRTKKDLKDTREILEKLPFNEGPQEEDLLHSK